ncbi:uncharacterized protein LOC100370901 [Saccoglossus kowalevskii]|uniref:Uncharacterized protein LOC100370901 n=1 Tax=Saccoglossus kowalevskii TaxID=10224 RepID=A0ABM0GPI9_SACKO|nr:PREDICTED: uncharacterized protein LOC100370901 [Saccoglossus kowalevskii]
MSDFVNQEIACLLNALHQPDIPEPRITDDPDWQEFIESSTLRKTRDRSDQNVDVWPKMYIRARVPSTEDNNNKVMVMGKNVNDAATEYEIENIQQHEMPVIGTFVDARIFPGFRYTVRILGTKNRQFGGKALKLLSIGKGYGKRFTFKGPFLNHNENYFWSDSHPDGYAFSINAVAEEEEFGIYDTAGIRHIGHAIVVHVSESQKEISQTVKPDKSIEKQLRLSMRCSVKLMTQPRGLVSEKDINFDNVVVTCNNRSENVEIQVELPFVGKCTLRSDTK